MKEDTLKTTSIDEEHLTTEKIAQVIKDIPKGNENRNLVRKITLFSILPQQHLLAQLDGGFIAEPQDKSALQTLWQHANNAYNNYMGLRSFLAEDDVRKLEGVPQSKVTSLLNQIKNYPPYDTHPTNIFDVRISKLITPQISVDPERAEKRANIKEKLNTGDLFDLVFKGNGKAEPINRQILGFNPNGGSVIFTSYDQDVRLHHPPQYHNLPIHKSDQDSLLLENVCMAVGGGLPFAVAYRIQIAPSVSRLILGNGIHRVYKLARAGYEWCPLIVCDLIPMELSEPFVDLPREILLNPSANPPLITDFLNDDVIIKLKYFQVLKTIRLNWNFEQYVTVLK